MVRHHVKKKKNAPKNKHAADKEQLEAELENLDRFAGSSDEESDGEHHVLSNRAEHGAVDMRSDEEESDEGGIHHDDKDDGDSDDGIVEEDMKEAAAEPSTNNPSHGGQSSSDESDNDYQDDQMESGDDNFDRGDTKAAGMSNAMARILGGAALLEPKKTTNTNVVLSKTTTPLQRLQQKIKSEDAALRQKRRDRRSENLSAMRLPLAPTAGMSADKLKKQRKNATQSENELAANAKDIAAEIESERTHRRIATRGVVALFNAISKHRAQVAAEAAAKEEEKKRIREEGGIKRKIVSQVESSKHGFLDMIKSAAANDKDVKGDEKVEKIERSGKKGVGWSALKDDFMMNSKLKDWDKELSDDDDEEEEDFIPAMKRVKA
ncbi:hypothetical protein ACHAWO_001336 [Cyclotella atomus]|uniref:RRP15-like protein n=1 Tax=Cyclotella atomus TaxID=382360 RepID=A0ABD3PSC2_9STRA